MDDNQIKKQDNTYDSFYFGTATSAYQIEGAVQEEGRGESIWDAFCAKKGVILDGSSGAIACDHYHRWEHDIELMKMLHVNSYRFSIAWPRIFPDKTQKMNDQGIDFYSRLIDRLLENRIEPFPTLYHWDLPQYLQEDGGWAARATSFRFADYASAVYDRFQDRITHWTTLNEPYVSAFMGYFYGVHAPGIQSPTQALSAVHHLLLAHGLAAKNMRSINRGHPLKIGIALNLSPAFPDDPEDIQAAEWYDTLHNKLFLDPLFGKGYPAQFLEEIGKDEVLNDFFMRISPGDLELIGMPLDFLGINYYTRGVVRKDDSEPLFRCKLSPHEPNPYSDMWDFYPSGLYELLERIHETYQAKEIFILENGTSLLEINDQMRIEFLKGHFEQISKAIKKEIPVKGYFVWSLLDNFEWSLGYTKRFGIIHVDFETQERLPKSSALWFRSLIS